MLPKPPKMQLGDFPDPGESPGQTSSSFESAIESEASTEGENDILREVWLGV
jgi:hypothetical protein